MNRFIRRAVVSSLLALAACGPSDSPAPSTPSSQAAPAPPQPTFEEAEARLKAGDRIGALKLANDVSRSVRQKSGERSVAYAAALFRVATIQLGTGDVASAVDSLQSASEIPGTDHPSRKDRLTYFMNLGECLNHLGRVEEAERVLRDGLKEREALYGRNHAGYAYGLQPLAETLLLRGKAADALPLIEECLTILEPERHQLLPETLVVRGFILKASGKSQGFRDFEMRDPRLQVEMVQDAAARSAIYEPSVSLPALKELWSRTRNIPGFPPEPLARLAVAVVNTARTAGDLETRLEGAHWLLSAAMRANDEGQVLHLLQGIALAYDEGRKPADAEKYYKMAIDRAGKGKDVVSLSNAQRNYGLFLSQQDRRKEAAPMLEAAVRTAESCGDAEVKGQALTANGIFLQHDKLLEKAGPLLREAVRLMDPAHPHALMARNHLNAIEKNASCGCGDMGEAIVQNLKRIIQESAPAGVIKDLQITLNPGNAPSVEVEYARTPTAEEKEKVDVAIRHAVSELQRRHREQR